MHKAMARKVLNNKVRISACGRSIEMRMSDGELKKLIIYSIPTERHETYGYLYNFSLYALFDYDIKSPSKQGRIYKNFPYHDFAKAMWELIKD